MRTSHKVAAQGKNENPRCNGRQFSAKEEAAAPHAPKQTGKTLEEDLHGKTCYNHEDEAPYIIDNIAEMSINSNNG